MSICLLNFIMHAQNLFIVIINKLIVNKRFVKQSSTELDNVICPTNLMMSSITLSYSLHPP